MEMRKATHSWETAPVSVGTSLCLPEKLAALVGIAGACPWDSQAVPVSLGRRTSWVGVFCPCSGSGLQELQQHGLPSGGIVPPVLCPLSETLSACLLSMVLPIQRGSAPPRPSSCRGHAGQTTVQATQLRSYIHRSSLSVALQFARHFFFSEI